MENVNSVVIVGNLTKDPELRTTTGGTSVASLRVAVNGREKGRDGEWFDRPNYFDVTVWGRQGESCAEHLHKGRPVAVQGRLRFEEWEAQGGGKRSAVRIVADRVQFLGSRDGGGGGDRAPHPAETAQEPPRSDVPMDTSDFESTSADAGEGGEYGGFEGSVGEGGDDIPF